MVKQETMALFPRLRFPEFGSEPWVQAQGGKLFDQISKRNAEVGLPILAITQEHGAIPRDLIDYHVSVSEKSIETYKVVERGDFIISLRSFQGGIEYSNYRGVCSPAYVILRKKGEGISAYFKHLFKSARFIQQLTRNIEGLRDGKMISYKQFSDQLIPTPKLAEQQRIADCLTSLDEVIAAQGRKVEALKAHKRGLMQQLFPREGETRPRLRFPEFRDAPDWREVSIGGIGEVITGSTPATSQREYYGGDHPFVSPADISDSRFVESTKTNLTDAGFAQARAVKAGSVLFVCIGSTIGKVAQNVRDCATNQQINAVVANSEFLGDFVYFLLDMEAERIAGLAGRQAVPIINKTLFSSVKVLAPRIGEQQRIADCLSSLDTRITAETNQLTALKTHKQGLMQQLFPAPDAASA